MLVIRFLRVGKKNAPSFRLVLTEKTAPPKGKFLEILGFLNPRTKEWGLRGERAQYWISKGAQPSATAHNFLVKHDAIKGAKISVHAKTIKEEDAPSTASEQPAKEGQGPVRAEPTAAEKPAETNKEIPESASSAEPAPGVEKDQAPVL